jgi:hypothetical protein
MRRTLSIPFVLLAAACAAGGTLNQPATLRVSMSGIQEVPGPGDPDANGTAEIRVNPRSGSVCWEVTARQIDAPTAAHIHRGVEGVAGPVVLALTPPDAAGHSRGCAALDPALVREIAAQSYNFYVNVHTMAFPNGALRGQLTGGPVMRQR